MFLDFNSEYKLNNLLNSESEQNKLFMAGDTRLSPCCVD